MVAAKKLVQIRIFLIVLAGAVLFLNGSNLYAQDDKKADELKRRIAELEKKKFDLNQKAVEKIDKSKEGEGQSIGEVIARYEKLLTGCTGKKSGRCSDVMYTLSKLYYDRARDEYVAARNMYEQKMDQWEKTQSGPEPVNPRPDYSKSLKFYQRSILEYPDFDAIDEAYFQIGTILTLDGDLDGSRNAFQELVNKTPGSIRASAAYFRLAELCFMDRDFSCALKNIEKIDTTKLTSEVREMAHYRKAEIYYNRVEFEKAANLFYTYIDRCDAGIYQKKDLRKEALEYLAICFSDMPSGGQAAIDFFKRVGDRDYRNYVIYTVGMKNFEHGQYEEAIISLQTAINNYPYYKDAPVAAQMIIACHVIKKKYDLANAEREKMVKNYWTSSEWASRNNNDKSAIENAKNEVRKALSQIPIYYHAEAQKNKKKEMFEKALASYNDYFTKFPDDKWRVYEFKYNVAEIYNMLTNFAKAAECYDFVAQQNLQTYPRYQQDELDTMLLDQEEKERVLKERGKKQTPVSISQEDAGYNAIVAYDNLRKKKKAESNLSDEQSYAQPETKQFLDYIYNFQKRFTNSSTAPEVMYLAANVHYSAKNYAAAITDFKTITSTYAQSKFANKSLRMLANCYANNGDYDLALSTFDKLLLQEKRGTPEYEEVLDLAAGSLFKKADNIRKANNLVGAADAFKAVYNRFPQSKVADRAWFEAAICYETANSLDLAAATFVEMGDKFPKSELREKAYVRAAENFKSLNRWEDAAKAFIVAAEKIPKADFAIPSYSSAYDCYNKIEEYGKAGSVSEMIYNKYPEDKRTPIALYNAGLIYEKGKLYPEAIRVYNLLDQKYPASEYAPEGYYAIGYCYEKMGDNVKMAEAFTGFAEKYTVDKSKQINAIVRAAEAYYNMNNLDAAQKNCEVAIDIYDKFKKKADIDVVAASKAFYTLGEIQQKKFRAIKLTGASEKDVQTVLREKTKALEPVLKAYASTIELGVGEWTIRATYMIGMSFVDMAEDFRNQKLFGSKDQQIASKIKIISSLEKYFLKAQEKFGWVVETAYEQGISNEYVDKSTQRFAEMAFSKGLLLEEVGLTFKNAPVPNGLPAEDRQAYIDVLEEKYLEALDAALPKFEDGLKEIATAGIVGSPWEDSVRTHIKFINPNSTVLELQVQARQPMPPKETPKETGSVVPRKATTPITAASTGSAAVVSDDRYERNMQRVTNVMDMNVSDEDKVAQLRSIEADAKREIVKEEERINELKSSSK
jgi:tetratricopeptide (TPR) repeat protein